MLGRVAWLLLVVAAPALALEAVAPSVVDQATLALCNKRVAVLAELPSHGEGVAFSLKADVVRALVQRCGFKVLVFEAPIYDFLGLQSRWGQGSATTLQLDQAIGRFWWARELADWRRWLFTEANEGRIAVGGIDDQVSITSEYARATLPALVAVRSPDDLAERCRAATERNLQWSYNQDHGFDDAEKRLLNSCAARAWQTAASAAPLGGARVEQAMLGNWASYVARQIGQEGAKGRDEVMYSNLQRQLEQMPADTKLIVWTATVHGSREQGARPETPLGARLAAQWGDALGVVGFTSYSGKSSMAGLPIKTMEPAPDASLEARALESGDAATYLDRAKLAELGEIESRLLGKFTVADWSKRFDGVIVVREESPATFEIVDATTADPSGHKP